MNNREEVEYVTNSPHGLELEIGVLCIYPTRKCGYNRPPGICRPLTEFNLFVCDPAIIREKRRQRKSRISFSHRRFF